MAQILPKNWGKNLVYHKNLMKTEYKKNIKRVRQLAEERHVQYRQEFVEYTRKKIDDNKKTMAEESEKIKIIANRNNNQKTLLDFGFDKVQQQLRQAKLERQQQSRLKNDRMKELEAKGRREWLMEMNDKCHLWNRSPEELKYAQYRLLDKKVLERLPRDANYVLDRSQTPSSSLEVFEISDQDGYKGPLRTNTQKIAYIIANGKELPIDKPEDIDQYENKDLLANIDKNSELYQEYLEFLEEQGFDSNEINITSNSGNDDSTSRVLFGIADAHLKSKQEKELPWSEENFDEFVKREIEYRTNLEVVDDNIRYRIEFGKEFNEDDMIDNDVRNLLKKEEETTTTTEETTTILQTNIEDGQLDTLFNLITLQSEKGIKFTNEEKVEKVNNFFTELNKRGKAQI